jgi:hypothetical protein
MLPVRLITAALFAAYAGACGNSNTDRPPASGVGAPEDSAADDLDDDAGVEADAHATDEAADADAKAPAAEATCTLQVGAVTTPEQASVSPDDAPSLVTTSAGAFVSYVAYDGGLAALKQILLTGDSSAPLRSLELPAGGGDAHKPRAAHVGSRLLTMWSEPNVDRLHAGLWMRATDLQSLTADAAVVIEESAPARTCSAIAAGTDGNALVVYLPRDAAAGVARVVDETALNLAPEVPLASLTGCTGAPALASLGDGYVLAWVDSSDARRVQVQRLDAAGAPAGEAFAIDAEGGARGNVDLATSNSGGAVVWDVLVAGERPEVRLRAFDEELAPSSVERVISAAPDLGLMPSIAAYRGGYAVGYRSQAGTSTRLRVAFTRQRGEPVGGGDVSELVDVGTPVALRAAVDGSRLWAAWIDRVGESTTYALSSAEVTCE